MMLRVGLTSWVGLDRQPTFAGKVIDIVTAHPDTEEGRKEALKAVNQTILLIVAVVIVGYVVCVPCSYHTMLDQLM
jgi:hypothetical protein